MNQLHPELRRLIRCPSAAEHSSTPSAPLGFAGRVIAIWRAEHLTTEPWWWRRMQVVTAWASAILIAAGIALWAGHQSTLVPTHDIFHAYQLAVRNFTP